MNVASVGPRHAELLLELVVMVRARLRWMSPDFRVSSPLKVPGRRLVTLYILSRDVGAALYLILWAAFTLRGILSIVRASGAEEKGLF